MRKLWLSILTFIAYFTCCTSPPQNINKSKSKIANTSANNVTDFKNFNDPVINLDIKSIRDAYAFEKKLGSKISYFPQRVLIEGNLAQARQDYYDSIMIRPQRPTELPGFVIFKRTQKYDYPLNVIYEYNVRTNIVSCIYYEWAPQWIHYPSSYQADTAIKNSGFKYASNEFYKDKHKQLFKLLLSKFKMYPPLTDPKEMPEHYNVDSLLEHPMFDGGNAYFGENENYFVRLEYIDDFMDLYPFVSDEFRTKPFRGLTLGFFLKRNLKYDHE